MVSFIEGDEKKNKINKNSENGFEKKITVEREGEYNNRLVKEKKKGRLIRSTI